tara:strand:- start:827 stop:1150 length:324 start_codon:yes stop_codon:yes gene_type:complete
MKTIIKEKSLSDVPYPVRLCWHSDSGHSWLQVPASFVLAVGFEPSTYSYINDGFFYLEEDCDAPKFIKLIGHFKDGVITTHDNFDIKIIEVDDGVDSPIRNYARVPN